MPYQRFILILFFALLLELCIYKVHKNKCKADSISIKQVDYTKKKRKKKQTKNKELSCFCDIKSSFWHRIDLSIQLIS